jgi:hypothetical protein
MKLTISKVEPFIKDKVQYVRLTIFQNKREIELTYDYVFNHMWQIRVTELELLYDSFLEPIYYHKGEVLPNGRKVNSNFNHVRFWKLNLNGSQYEIRQRNNQLCKVFDQVYTATYCRTKTNRELVKFITVTGQSFFEEFSKVKLKTGLNVAELYLLKGAYVACEFYKAGEVHDNACL